MAMKAITFSQISVQTKVNDNQRTERGTPDPYLIFKSRNATVGNRDNFQRNSWTPAFPGPYVVGFGGAQVTEQVVVELWDRDRGSGSGDDIMENVTIDFSSEAERGAKSWKLSSGGELTLSWVIRGRTSASAPVMDPATSSPSEGIVRIQRMAASDLGLMDGERGAVDCYVLLTGTSRNVSERWEHQQNNASPEWLEVHEFPYDPEGYSLEVWDFDFGRGNGDDLCGRANLKLEPTSGSESTIRLSLLEGRGEIALTYVLSSADSSPVSDSTPPATDSTPPATSEPPALAPVAPPVVVRKEIRKMGRAEQERFIAALRKLMENESGPGTSEYFRLAGYHGWPNDYCQHGQETFPGWHRGYLCELEQSLIKADKALGQDGNIGLPYWDWSTEVNGEVFPRILRERFPELPEGLIDKGAAGRLGERGYSQIRSDGRLRQRIRSAKAAMQAEQCLTVAEHWMHASTRHNRSGSSVESPHNSIHVACGFPMTSLRYAAFHPVFFLHHCNVDRIYEKHVQMETPGECAQEFASTQQIQSQQGEENRYLEPLEPFMHPLKPSQPLMPSDTLNVKNLGYVYDELPPDPTMMMRAEPTFAAFCNVDIVALDRKSYTLHVFLMPKADTATWSAPAGQPDDWFDHPNYAGNGAVISGKDGCSNCLKRPRFNVLVEVQDCLARLGLNRHDTDIKVMCEDEAGVALPRESTLVPQPVLIGPCFEDPEAMLSSHGDTWAESEPSGEVVALQKLLQKNGFYPADTSMDGKFGPKTDQAVRDYQTFTGLKVDGIAGPKTKAQMLAALCDGLPILMPEPQKKALSRFTSGQTLRYAVGPVPGYLQKHLKTVHAEIQAAFDQWGDAMGMQFKRAASQLNAQFFVRFADLAHLSADGVAKPGGQLAEATPQGVTLDAGERWLLQEQDAPKHCPLAVYLSPIILHEVGHCLGLAHSSSPKDAMWPYSRPGVRSFKLSAADKARVRSKVMAASLEGVLRLFKQYDMQGKGLISEGKLKNVIRNLSPVHADEAAEILRAYPPRTEGDIDYVNFFAWLSDKR